MTLSEKIKKMRVENGLTIYAAAKGSQVDFKTMKFLEQGRFNPRVSTLDKISRFYGLSIVELFEGVD